MKTFIDITDKEGKVIKRNVFHFCNASQLADLLVTVPNCTVTWDLEANDDDENKNSL